MTQNHKAAEKEYSTAKSYPQTNTHAPAQQKPKQYSALHEYHTIMVLAYGKVRGMRLQQALTLLDTWDTKQSYYVWLRRDLRKIFEEPERTFAATLARLEEAHVLERAVRGVYVYRLSRHIGIATLDTIARQARRGYFTYLSLESALNYWGAIDQILLDRRTYMTLGRSGEFATPYGVIEYTHTSLPRSYVYQRCVRAPERDIAVANAQLAYENLQSVHRNLDLVNMEAFEESQTTTGVIQPLTPQATPNNTAQAR